MGFLNILTLIFITLKLMNYISWGWFIVLSPSILSVTLYVFFHGYIEFKKDQIRRGILK